MNDGIQAVSSANDAVALCFLPLVCFGQHDGFPSESHSAAALNIHKMSLRIQKLYTNNTQQNFPADARHRDNKAPTKKKGASGESAELNLVVEAIDGYRGAAMYI
mmetsp:Transcript_19190/g.61724  ORF Transcript_19190/g.61724 Transcript_19190/m.61724 type:complete len:105 (-) Transcript_19190:195-509(-)